MQKTRGARVGTGGVRRRVTLTSAESKRSAIATLAGILEERRALIKEQVGESDEGALFEIADRYDLRHRRADQRGDYDEAFLYWIFWWYLATVELTNRARAGWSLLGRAASPYRRSPGAAKAHVVTLALGLGGPWGFLGGPAQRPALPSSGDLVQQFDAGGVVAHGRGEHHHRDHQAQHVNGQAALAARYFFAASHPVDSAGTPAATCTLRVSSTTRLKSAFRRAFSRTC
ncbi:putative protein OS=Streptomyces aurantiogriseus OX=66870 GN=GCM10010251_26830 PE=4 SV=1 [Streptomyces aurantiogriseus]|uniref:Uncharacterized protein n=1 Tax=Streptomyces aurantiogriseus TaxID=66870 RepID=A0A918C7X6_9ACTN|nr:hypothetical protein GCM10010251_26830 [Streptomyces aurantiogriseus]